jgi:hypothetical protein
MGRTGKPVTAVERDALTKAREQLANSRVALAEQIAASGDIDLPKVEALIEVLAAIEAIDRALIDAGHPYMPRGTE